MSNAQLETAIEAAWEVRDTITPSTGGEVREAIEDTLNALDGGTLRVAEKQADGNWHVNQWAKKAVLLGMGNKLELWSEQAHLAKIRETINEEQITEDMLDLKF